MLRAIGQAFGSATGAGEVAGTGPSMAFLAVAFGVALGKLGQASKAEKRPLAPPFCRVLARLQVVTGPDQRCVAVHPHQAVTFHAIAGAHEALAPLNTT